MKKLLLTISKGEKSIERQRQRLAKLNNFEPYAAFMRVDRDENGVIGSVEILRFLRYPNYYSSDRPLIEKMELKRPQRLIAI